MLVAQAGGECAVCGYDRCILNLHFHHVDPASKSFNMTMAAGKSAAAYLAEASKCVLVCANCHGEIEAGLIESPPAPGANFRPTTSQSDPTSSDPDFIRAATSRQLAFELQDPGSGSVIDR
jgi:hypothetical protein